MDIGAHFTSRLLHASPQSGSSSSFLQRTLENSNNLWGENPLEMMVFALLSDFAHLGMSKRDSQVDAFHVFLPSLTMDLLIAYILILLLICIVYSHHRWRGLFAIFTEVAEAQGPRCHTKQNKKQAYISLSVGERCQQKCWREKRASH